MEEKTVRAKGFFRVNIVEHGADGESKVVGDSGWIENMITNSGVELYMARCFAAQSGSLTVGYVTLGSGTTPASDATTLPGEVTSTTRSAPTYGFTQRAASNGTCTIQFTAAFDSGTPFLDTSYDLANVGLVNSTSGGSIMCGNTFASSSCATNQNVNVTYQVRLSFS